jgi:hypothetical protein
MLYNLTVTTGWASPRGSQVQVVASLADGPAWGFSCGNYPPRGWLGRNHLETLLRCSVQRHGCPV